MSQIFILLVLVSKELHRSFQHVIHADAIPNAAAGFVLDVDAGADGLQAFHYLGVSLGLKVGQQLRVQFAGSHIPLS
jgi:hypothetical protein